MSLEKANVVHDELGRIVAIGRISEGASAIRVTGEGQSFIETEVEASSFDSLLELGFVDIATAEVVSDGRSRTSAAD